MTPVRTDVYNRVTDQVITQLEAGTWSWSRGRSVSSAKQGRTSGTAARRHITPLAPTVSRCPPSRASATPKVTTPPWPMR
jgi:hypothetical protein